MQNAITTKIFKAPVCWCLKRFLNQPSCNESIIYFYYFQTFLQNVLRESGFGTKGKFSFLLGRKFPRRDENMNFSRFFFHLMTKHSFQRFFYAQNNAKIDTFFQITFISPAVIVLDAQIAVQGSRIKEKITQATVERKILTET